LSSSVSEFGCSKSLPELINLSEKENNAKTYINQRKGIRDVININRRLLSGVYRLVQELQLKATVRVMIF